VKKCIPPNAELDFTNIADVDRSICLEWEMLREVQRRGGDAVFRSALSEGGYLIHLESLMFPLAGKPFALLSDVEKGYLRAATEGGSFGLGLTLDQPAYANPKFALPIDHWQRVTIALSPNATNQEIRDWFRLWLKGNRKGKGPGRRRDPMTMLYDLVFYRLREFSAKESMKIFHEFYPEERQDCDESAVSKAKRIVNESLTRIVKAAARPWRSEYDYLD
jgi:hypothetical protein